MSEQQEISYRALRAMGFRPMSKNHGCYLQLGGGFFLDYFEDTKSFYMRCDSSVRVLGNMDRNGLRNITDLFRITLNNVNVGRMKQDDDNLESFIRDMMHGKGESYLKSNRSYMMIYACNEMRRLDTTHSIFDVEKAVDAAYKAAGIEI